MPQYARHHGPFGNPHIEQRDGGRRQWRFHEQRVGDQFGMGRQGGGALVTAGAAAGEDVIQFPHQIAQFLGRQIGWGQSCLFIGIDIFGEAGMSGARTKRDVRLAVPDEQDTHG